MLLFPFHSHSLAAEKSINSNLDLVPPTPPTFCHHPRRRSKLCIITTIIYRKLRPREKEKWSQATFFLSLRRHAIFFNFFFISSPINSIFMQQKDDVGWVRESKNLKIKHEEEFFWCEWWSERAYVGESERAEQAASIKIFSSASRDKFFISWKEGFVCL